MRFLSIKLSGRDEAMRAYFAAHPTELHGTNLGGDLRTVRIFIAEAMLEVIRSYGLNAEVLYDASEVGRSRLKEVASNNRFEIGSGSNTTVALAITAADKYLNVLEVEAATKRLADSYPQFCQLIDLPEPTSEGRRCNALCINVAPPQAPTILILGGIHGREWGSCEIALEFVDRLLAACQTSSDLIFGGATFAYADLAHLLQTRRIVVFPLVNPDGRAFSQSPLGDPLWRKNRNPQWSDGNTLSAGVDINRNFDFLFDTAKSFAPGAGVLVSANFWDHDLYQGPYPFSEVESRNVKRLLDEFGSTAWLVDLHSCSRTVMCPWGDDEVQETDSTKCFFNPQYDQQRGKPGDAYSEYMPSQDVAETRRLVAVLRSSMHGVSGVQYAASSGFGAFATPGTSHDYAYSRHFLDASHSKVLGFVVEWGDEFHPPWATMKVIVNEVAAGLTAFCIAC